MRITGGRLKNRKLHLPPGAPLRPSSDKTRARLFSMLRTRLSPFPPRRVLDLFAGTGALGLEALSRGSCHCTFVEQNPAQCRFVRAQLRALNLDARAVILRRDALRLQRPPGALGPFALALLDPPYGDDWWPVLARLARFGWLAPRAICAVETERPRAAAPPIGAPDFAQLAVRDDGRVRLIFYRWKGGA